MMNTQGENGTIASSLSVEAAEFVPNVAPSIVNVPYGGGGTVIAVENGMLPPPPISGLKNGGMLPPPFPIADIPPPPPSYVMNYYPLVSHTGAIRAQQMSRFPPPYSIPTTEMSLSNGIMPPQQQTHIPLIEQQLNPTQFNSHDSAHSLFNMNSNSRHTHPGVFQNSWLVPSGGSQPYLQQLHHQQQRQQFLPPQHPPPRQIHLQRQRNSQHQQQQYSQKKQNSYQFQHSNQHLRFPFNHLQLQQHLPPPFPPPSHSPKIYGGKGKRGKENALFTTSNTAMPLQILSSLSPSTITISDASVATADITSPLAAATSSVTETCQSISPSLMRNGKVGGCETTGNHGKNKFVSNRPPSPVLISRSSQTDSNISLGFKDMSLQQKSHPLFTGNQSAFNKVVAMGKRGRSCDNNGAGSLFNAAIEEVVLDPNNCVSIQVSPAAIDKCSSVINISTTTAITSSAKFAASTTSTTVTPHAVNKTTEPDANPTNRQSPLGGSNCSWEITDTFAHSHHESSSKGSSTALNTRNINLSEGTQVAEDRQNISTEKLKNRRKKKHERDMTRSPRQFSSSKLLSRSSSSISSSGMREEDEKIDLQSWTDFPPMNAKSAGGSATFGATSDISVAGPVLIQRAQGGPPWSLKEMKNTNTPGNSKMTEEKSQHVEQQRRQKQTTISKEEQRQKPPSASSSQQQSPSFSHPSSRTYATITHTSHHTPKSSMGQFVPSDNSSWPDIRSAPVYPPSHYQSRGNPTHVQTEPLVDSHQNVTTATSQFPPLVPVSTSSNSKMQSFPAAGAESLDPGATTGSINSSSRIHWPRSPATNVNGQGSNENSKKQSKNSMPSHRGTSKSPGRASSSDRSKSPASFNETKDVRAFDRGVSKSPARFETVPRSKAATEIHLNKKEDDNDDDDDDENDDENDDKSTTKRRRRRRRRNHVRTKKGRVPREGTGENAGFSLDRTVSSSNVSETTLHFEDTEEFPDLISASRGLSQDGGILGGGGGDRSTLSGTSLSYSDIARMPWNRRDPSLSRTQSLTGSCVSEDNADDLSAESKRARKRRKRREQANKAAETELAEISLEQEWLREGLKKTALRGGDSWPAPGKHLASPGIISSPGVVQETKKVTGTGGVKKSHEPITLDFAAMIEASQTKSADKKSPKGMHKRDSRSSSAKRSTSSLSRPANPLDSSAPVQRRGKERETPKAKKPSPLKKVILKEREAKKQLRLMDGTKDVDEFGNTPGVGMVAADSELSQDALSSKSGETDQERVEDSEHANLSADLSPISQTSPISMSPASPGNSGVNSPISGSVGRDSVIMKIHSRRFREYCNQVLDKEIDQCCTDLLQDLVRFQDRLYHKDPLKAKRKRRVVLGLREVTKHLRLKKIKCVVVSPNLEKIQSKGGLDEALNNILTMCQEQNVPFVFALGRRALGRACAKLVPVSVVGVFNFHGSEESYNRLVSLTAHARSAYNEMVAAVEREVAAASTFNSVPGLVPAHMGHSRTPSGCSAISFTSSVLSEPHSEYYTNYADDNKASDGNSKGQGFELDDGNEADIEDFGDSNKRRRGVRGNNSVRFGETEKEGGGVGSEGIASGFDEKSNVISGSGSVSSSNPAGNSNAKIMVVDNSSSSSNNTATAGGDNATRPHPPLLLHNHHIHGHHRRQSSVSSLARIMEGIDDDREEITNHDNNDNTNNNTTTTTTTVIVAPTTTITTNAIGNHITNTSDKTTKMEMLNMENKLDDGGVVVGSGGGKVVEPVSPSKNRLPHIDSIHSRDYPLVSEILRPGGVLNKAEGAGNKERGEGLDEEGELNEDEDDEDVGDVDDDDDDDDNDDDEGDDEDEDEEANKSRSRLRGHTRQKSMDKKERIENWLSTQSNLNMGQ